MEPMLTIALRAARKGAEILEKATQHRDIISIEEKAQNDYVTEVDRAVEKEIIYQLKRAYPDHGFQGEESGNTAGNSPYTWIIDPIDGTTNFIHGIPHFAISIACVNAGRIEHAVVLDPVKREEFTASRGKGAMMNGRRIRTHEISNLKGALIATGIPFNTTTMPYLEVYINSMNDIIQQQTAGIRRMGAASLDLAYVAAGRMDGFWEMKLKPWDIAAGILLIQEAGGFVSDFNGGNQMLDSGNIVAASSKVFKQLLPIVSKHLKEI